MGSDLKFYGRIDAPVKFWEYELTSEGEYRLSYLDGAGRYTLESDVLTAIEDGLSPSALDIRDVDFMRIVHRLIRNGYIRKRSLSERYEDLKPILIRESHDLERALDTYNDIVFGRNVSNENLDHALFYALKNVKPFGGPGGNSTLKIFIDETKRNFNKMSKSDKVIALDFIISSVHEGGANILKSKGKDYSSTLALRRYFTHLANEP